MGILLRTIKYLTTIIIVVSGFGIAGLAILYFYFAYDLPNIQSLKDYKPPVVSEAFDENGAKIGEFWTECRYWLPVEAIPKQIINAFVSAEDTRFFEHRGVDPLGILRAMFENVKAGHVVQGGSTITQQITRSILLNQERKVARKVREAILATRIERNLNKEQILELYLNQIFLGNRAYGIKAAARNYFNKSVNELTIAESAMIAGMPTAPTIDSPIHNPEKARERQTYVINRMYEHGFITKDQKNEALAEKLKIYVAGIDRDFNYKYAPYFTEYVRQLVQNKYGDKVLYQGGLRIFTTANLAYNQAAEKALRKGLEALDKREGYRGIVGNTQDAATFAENIHKELWRQANSEIVYLPRIEQDKSETPIVTDKFYKAVVTGIKDNNLQILVGHREGIIPHKGYKWARSFNPESAGYNDVNYVAQASSKFKIGDIVLVKYIADNEFALAQKPLVQGAVYSMDPHTGAVKAMIGGYDFADSEFNRAYQALRQPGSSFKPFIYSAALDKGYKYNTPILDAPVAYYVGVGQPMWTPKNYGGKYAGLTTFESDIIHSRNVPTIKIANDIGLHYLTAYIRKMGLTTPIGKYLSMALGSNGVYLNEMVAAYSTFATNGIKPEAYYITKITDADGNVLEERSPVANDNLKDEATDVTDEMAKKLKNLNKDLFMNAQKNIESDGLILSQDELKVLYGEVIPDGYTITPQTAYLMTNLLRGVVDRGTGTVVKGLGKPVAGKTGTTNDETDCWFVGFVPDLAAGVWIGFDNIAKIGSLETGGHTAAPIFLDYMKEATKDMEAKNFEAPKGLKSSNLAALSGGSAVYFKGYSLLREGLAGEHKVSDRAVDFFEEDLDTRGPAPKQVPKSSGGKEDDLAY